MTGKTGKRDKPQPHTGGGLWAHVIETSILAAIVAGIAVSVARTAHLSWWQLPLIEILISLIAVVSALIIAQSEAIAWYLGTWGAFIATWSGFAYFYGVLRGWVFLAGSAFTLIMIMRGVTVYGRESAYKQQIREKTLALQDPYRQDLTGWEKTLRKCGVEGIKVTDVTSTRAGEDVFFEALEGQDVSITSLRTAQLRIEQSRKLHRGALRFDEGAKSHEFVLHVTHREVLKETVRFPLEYEPRTITEPFPVGVYENGDLVMVKFRELAALVVGVTRSGKSNFLNVLISSLVQCDDVVIFMIDMKGGMAAAPWLVPFINGECKKPAIAWVATTRAETDLMIETLLAWTDMRARRAAPKEKIIPSRKQPAIVLIVDEMAVVFGQQTGRRLKEGEVSNVALAGKAGELTRLGSGLAINPIYATQRGTVTMIGDGDLKSQCKLKVGFGVARESDARMIFEDDAYSAKLLKRLSGIQGAGLIELGDVGQPFKAYRVDPDDGDIHTMATLTGNDRPDPEPALITAAGKAWTERWTVRGQAYLAQIKAGTLEEDPDDIFESLTSTIEPDQNVDPRRLQVRQMVEERGLTGHTPFAVWHEFEKRGIDIARETVNRWMVMDAEDGLMTVSDPNTRNVRYRWASAGRSLPRTGTEG